MMRRAQEGPCALLIHTPDSDTEVSMVTGHFPTSSQVLLEPFAGGRKFPGLELLGALP